MSIVLVLALWLQTAKLDEATEAFRAGYAAKQRGDLGQAHVAFAEVVRLMPGVAAGHTALGMVLLQENNLTPAIAELKIAHRIDSTDAIAISGLADAYSRQSRFPELVGLLATVPDDVILSPETSISFATALTSTGDPSAATRQLRHSIDREPNSAALHDALGSVLAQQKMYEAARSEIEQAIHLESQLASPHYHLGSLDLIEQKNSDAITELTLALSFAPNSIDTLVQLGRAETRARQDQQAVATLRHAYELAPTYTEAKYELAIALQNTGDFSSALPLFSQVAISRPNDPQALANYALALVQSGDARSAFHQYQTALRFDPDNPILHEDFGVAYLQTGDLDHALEQFRFGLLLVKDDRSLSASLHYDAGLTLKLKDRLPEAIAELVQAEELDQNLPDPPYTLGVLYMQIGAFDKSATCLGTATALRPDNGEAWSLLGSVYQQMNETEKAMLALRRAIELQPEQPGPHIVLAGLLAKQGDRAGAAAERTKAAALSRVAVDQQKSDFVLKSASGKLQRGDIDGAITELRNAIVANEHSIAFHRLLADALARKGTMAEAAIERQKVSEIESGNR